MPSSTRPAVRLNMIASVDGATALAGVSGGLGGAADQALFAVLRSQDDVVLVAAGTHPLAEGGPSLNGQLAADGLLDEPCVTLSPVLVGGGSKRILTGPELMAGPGWILRSMRARVSFPPVPPGAGRLVHSSGPGK